MTSGSATGVVGPHDLLFAWSVDPLVLVGLLAAMGWYARGVHALGGVGRGGAVVSRGRTAAFAGGVSAVVAAVVSPLDALSEVLFSAHMAQHLLLTLVAAPLFVLAAPLLTMARGLPSWLQRRAGRWYGRVRRLLARPWLPGAGLAAYTLVFTLWHLPWLYNASLRSDIVHGFEHWTLLAAAFGLWGPVLRPRRTHPGAGVVLLFLSMIASGLLAVLLVFAPSAWYAHAATRVYGLTPLQDQQAAGAVMWVVGGIVYVVSGAAVLVRWLRADQRLVARRERHTPRRA